MHFLCGESRRLRGCSVTEEGEFNRRQNEQSETRVWEPASPVGTVGKWVLYTSFYYIIYKLYVYVVSTRVLLIVFVARSPLFILFYLLESHLSIGRYPPLP